MVKTLFMTGYPGFLASEVLRLLLTEHAEFNFICLIQPKFKKMAEEQLAAAIKNLPGVSLSRIALVEGDITQPYLGLAKSFTTENPIHQIFHFAAVYDLGVSRETGIAVNLNGTRNMLKFAKTVPGLERFHYVSTCYVSGKYAGNFSENDLIKEQTFNNYYEETKYLAEVEVQKAMAQGLPTTIYRPAVVVGNSHTGATQKFDGPYYVIQWLLRQNKKALLPKIGDPTQFEINLVPSDFVCEAIAKLSQLDSTKNKVLHLSDPKPLKVAELIADLEIKTQKKILQLPLPISIARTSLKFIPGLEKFLKIPVSTLNYFVHPTHYSTSGTEPFLKEANISCPPFPSYSEKLVDFMKQNPHLRTQALT